MKTNLLVVDDEVEIQQMLSRHFTYLGYSVDTASNGKEALKILENKKFDILISDIMMPEMDGVELLRQVRDQYPMIRPIMITGYVNLDNALACIRYRADACVFKPLKDLGELESAVTEAERKNSYWLKILKELQGLKSS